MDGERRQLQVRVNWVCIPIILHGNRDVKYYGGPIALRDI